MAPTYQLGDVATHVRAAADRFGPLHGIQTVGGWREQGSVPNSDHPKGLALDFMTRSKTRGDALAADLIANAKEIGLTYVIWWRQIWTPGLGWQPYSGPSPHTDHVHASFVEKPGAAPSRPGVSLVDNSIIGAVRGVGDQLGNIAGSMANVGRVAELLARLAMPTNIIRAAAAGAGTIFILIGVWFIAREARQ